VFIKKEKIKKKKGKALLAPMMEMPTESGA
jgi:hypothetical protein